MRNIRQPSSMPSTCCMPYRSVTRLQPKFPVQLYLQLSRYTSSACRVSSSPFHLVLSLAADSSKLSIDTRTASTMALTATWRFPLAAAKIRGTRLAFPCATSFFPEKRSLTSQMCCVVAFHKADISLSVRRSSGSRTLQTALRMQHSISPL